MSLASPSSRPPRGLTHSVRVLAFLSTGALIITRELSMNFVGVFILLVALSLWIERYPRVTHLIRKFQPLLAIAAFFVAVMDFTHLSRSFLLTVAHFLLTLQGLRLLALRTVRDHVGSMLLSSMMILSASTLSVEWSFFVFLFLFLPLIIWNLILLNLTQESQVHQVMLDPAATPTQLDEAQRGLSEEGFLPDGHPMWQRCAAHVRLSTLTACATTALCCGVVFVVFPRFNFRGFRGQFLQPVHKTAFTTQVDLLKESRIFLDNSVVMRVEIKARDRGLWPGYLRGATLNYFDGRIWSRGTMEQPQAVYRSGGAVRLPMDVRHRGPLLEQSIYLESMDSPVLFGAPVAVAFQLDRPALLVGADATVERWRGDSWRLHYTATSLLQSKNGSSWPEFVERGQFSTSRPTSMNLLPARFEASSIRNLASTWIRSQSTPLGEARAIESTFQTTYRYSLDLRHTSGDLLQEFLFKTKKGNCEYFASAMCVMLRSIGIPSRMVTGFYAHEWNARGQYFIVRMKDAHAWVEAYIPHSGWVQFDPTPRQFIDEEESHRAWNRFQDFFDLINLEWNRTILSYDMEKQLSIFRAVEQQSYRMSGRLDKFMEEIRRWWRPSTPNSKSASTGEPPSHPWIPIVGLIGVMGGVMLWRRRRSFSAADKKVWFYPELVKFLSRRGVGKFPHQTLTEFMASLPPLDPTWEPDLRYLAAEYHRRRFGPVPIEPENSDDSIRESLKRLKH